MREEAAAEGGAPRGITRALQLATLILYTLLLLSLVALDWHGILGALPSARPTFLFLALVFTATSYICVGWSFAFVCRLFGIQLGWRELALVGFVSTALNNLLTFGGAIGHSVRLVTLQRRGIKKRDILVTSLIYSYINLLAMFALLLLSSGRLLATQSHEGYAIGVLATVVGLTTIALFVQPFRRPVFRGVGRACRRVLPRLHIEPHLRDLDEALARFTTTVRAHPATTLMTLAMVAADWLASALVIACCLEATGARPSFAVSLTGFATGVTMGVLSMVPGGLGVQDLSMAGIYALLGVDIRKAALAVLLFRVLYYFVPSAISLMFYRRLSTAR